LSRFNKNKRGIIRARMSGRLNVKLAVIQFAERTLDREEIEVYQIQSGYKLMAQASR